MIRFMIFLFFIIFIEGLQGEDEFKHIKKECSGKPQVRYYRFIIENFSTMGPACKGCPANYTACGNKECVLADGYQRSIITINRQMPGPAIQVCQGDTIVVDVENQLIGEDTSIHWYGQLQKGTQYMDGVTFITQCPIPGGTTFRYKFKAKKFGTYFYQSQHGLQKMDGLSGLFIVRSAKDPSLSLYDTDHHVLFLQDWTHEITKGKIPGLMKMSRRGQLPRSLLINGRGNVNIEKFINTGTPLAKLRVERDARHRVRIVNAGGFECPLQLIIQNHEMTVIAVDGYPIESAIVDSVILLSGERVDVVLHANQPAGVYWIIVRALGECRKNKIYQKGLLVYKGAGKSRPKSPVKPGYEDFKSKMILNPMGAKCGPGEGGICTYQLRSLNNYYRNRSLDKFDNKNTLKARFNFYNYKHNELFGIHKNGHKDFYIPAYGDRYKNYELQAGQINNVSMILPPSPPLSQPQVVHELMNSRFQYRCKRDKKKHQNCFHYYQYPLGSILDIVFVHESFGKKGEAHPMHLHGYRFQVMYQGYDFKKCRSSITTFRPVYKDTVNVPGSGCARVRIYLDNPGFWLLHSNIIHHHLSGMSMVLHVGKHSDLPKVPHRFPKCGNFVPKLN